MHGEAPQLLKPGSQRSSSICKHGTLLWATWGGGPEQRARHTQDVGAGRPLDLLPPGAGRPAQPLTPAGQGCGAVGLRGCGSGGVKTLRRRDKGQGFQGKLANMAKEGGTGR